MNRSIAALLLLVLSLLALGAWTQSSGPATGSAPSATGTKPPGALEQQLISYEKSMPEAQKKRDFDFYKHTLTDDFVAVGTDARLHPREEILADLRSTELVEYRPYDIQVVQLNDGAAVVTYDVIIQMSKYEEDIPRYQHISSIWVKQNNQWKLKFQQATAAR